MGHDKILPIFVLFVEGLALSPFPSCGRDLTFPTEGNNPSCPPGPGCKQLISYVSPFQRRWLVQWSCASIGSAEQAINGLAAGYCVIVLRGQWRQGLKHVCPGWDWALGAVVCFFPKLFGRTGQEVLARIPWGRDLDERVEDKHFGCACPCSARARSHSRNCHECPAGQQCQETGWG